MIGPYSSNMLWRTYSSTQSRTTYDEMYIYELREDSACSINSARSEVPWYYTPQFRSSLWVVLKVNLILSSAISELFWAVLKTGYLILYSAISELLWAVLKACTWHKSLPVACQAAHLKVGVSWYSVPQGRSLYLILYSAISESLWAVLKVRSCAQRMLDIILRNFGVVFGSLLLKEKTHV